MDRRREESSSGQALVEFALAAPLFFMVLIGIIVLGIMVFYNQQLTNAAREAARFASIHSATALCPTVSTLDPGKPGYLPGYSSAAQPPRTYLRCDTPSQGWPAMTAFARTKVFGLNPTSVLLSACWSGYVDPERSNFDARPPGTYQINAVSVTVNSEFRQCHIGGQDPTVNPESIACQSGLGLEDTASDASSGGAEGRVVNNRVTVYACFEWSPPAAGFLLIPETMTFRAVISEPIQRQQ